jgi:DNA-binding Lrp family transcriptional regulator
MKLLIEVTARNFVGSSLKDVELSLISALMKNSRNSDRKLARTLGVSQPTVTRLRSRLEKEGYIQEYTMLPNLAKLGFEILAFTFYKLKVPLSANEITEARKTIMNRARISPTAVIMALGGFGGIDADRIIVSFHKNYSDYVDFLKGVRHIPNVVVAESKSFLVDLKADTHFFPLSFSRLAEYIMGETEDIKKTSQMYPASIRTKHRGHSTHGDL